MGLIKKGDSRAFELLVARHQKTAYNLALRFLGEPDDAEDIVQEVFIRIYKAAGTYSPDAKFTTWLYTIIKNLCFNVLRQRKQAAIVSMEDESLPEIPSSGEDQLSRISRMQIREKVVKAVRGLPPNMRMAVILSKYHGMQYDEIAGIMGCSVNAVKLRIFRAKSLLAEELSEFRYETGDV